MHFQIAYASHSLCGGLSPELLDIVRCSLAWNAAHDVTGALFFDRLRFLQVLEGPEPAVDLLMRRIRRDNRHAGLRVLEAGPASRRLFPDTPMKFLDGDSTPGLGARLEGAVQGPRLQLFQELAAA